MRSIILSAALVAATLPAAAHAVAFEIRLDVPRITARAAVPQGLTGVLTGDTDDWVFDDPDWGTYLDFRSARFDVDGGAGMGGITTTPRTRFLAGWPDLYFDDPEGTGERDYFLSGFGDTDQPIGFLNRPGVWDDAPEGIRFGSFIGITHRADYLGLDQGYLPAFSYWTVTRVGAPAGAVPEPASWATLALGFGLLGMVLRRRGVQAARSRNAVVQAA